MPPPPPPPEPSPPPPTEPKDINIELNRKENIFDKLRLLLEKIIGFDKDYKYTDEDFKYFKECAKIFINNYMDYFATYYPDYHDRDKLLKNINGILRSNYGGTTEDLNLYHKAERFINRLMSLNSGQLQTDSVGGKYSKKTKPNKKITKKLRKKHKRKSKKRKTFNRKKYFKKNRSRKN